MRLSSGARKVADTGARALSLMFSPRAPVIPSARYPRRAADGVLVLELGSNPSTDYYLRPRLRDLEVPHWVADLRADPVDHPAFGCKALTVIFCRYASSAWLRRLDAERSRLGRVALFMDDDLLAMLEDSAATAAARGKIARHHFSHAPALGQLCSELWVSSPALRNLYGDLSPVLLPPTPDALPPAPSSDAPPLIVHHATDTHAAERQFVLELARQLPALRAAGVIFEIVGGPHLAREAAGMDGVRVVDQAPWPQYRDRQSARSAALLLAPLLPSAVNAARAPVKAFDALRLGAAGLYADTPPFQGFIRGGMDGLLLPMQPEAWASAITELMRDPGRRLSLSRAAAERFGALAAAPSPLPEPA